VYFTVVLYDGAAKRSTITEAVIFTVLVYRYGSCSILRAAALPASLNGTDIGLDLSLAALLIPVDVSYYPL